MSFELDSNKALKGVSYLFSEKIGKLLIGLFIHSLLARHLSPAHFGELGYIINFATAFLPLTLFGLEEQGIKRIVSGEEASQVTSEVICIRFISLTAVTLISGLFLFFFGPDSDSNLLFATWIFCFFYNLIGVFYSLEITFQSHIYNKPLFQSRFGGYLIGSGLKILGVMKSFSFTFILCSYLIEEFIGKAILAISYFKTQTFKKPDLSGKNLLKYFRTSFWIVTGVFFMVIESKIGFYFIERFADAKSLSFFTAAFMLVDLWVFIPIALMNVFLPLLVNSKDKDPFEYRKILEKIHGIFFGLEILFISGVYLVAPALIKILYGGAFQGAETFLRWQALVVIISFTQILRMRWFLVEGKIPLWAIFSFTHFLTTVMIISIFDLEGNIQGIVTSSLVSFLVVNIILSFINRFYKNAFLMNVKSLSFFYRFLRSLKRM